MNLPSYKSRSLIRGRGRAGHEGFRKESEAGKYGFATDRFATDTIAFYEGVIPDEIKHFDDNCFDWVVCISLMVMIISNLGWGKWDTMQKELLRVSRNGVLCLEYTDPEVYYLVRSN